MADYIYTMETRLTPDQMRVVSTVQQIAKSHGMNLYLTGGAIRDILTGFPIRDLDFTVQGNPLEFQRELEAAGGVVDMVDRTFCVIHVVFQGTRAEISMARSETFDKPGKPPAVTPATINEDLRRRDFTFNAMALSLNEGSKGLLLDPYNGAADIDAKLIRILHSYAFLEEPSRLIRATRFGARFGYELEERTKARYDSAKEGEYIQYVSPKALAYETEQVAHEENPVGVMQALEREGWLKVLNPKWTAAKAEDPELLELLKTREAMTNLNITVDAAPAVMHFLTHKLGEAEVVAIQKSIPHKEFVESWKRLDTDAKELSKKLLSKEAATNSGAWNVLSAAKPEAILYLDVTGRNKTVDEKIKSFLGKWRQVQEKIPYTEMTQLRITPQLPEYPKIVQEAFLLLLDGKLRSEAEIMKFLAPYEPPPPPPPPTAVRRGRVAKKAAAAVKAPMQEQAAPPVVAKAAPEKHAGNNGKGEVAEKHPPAKAPEKKAEKQEAKPKATIASKAAKPAVKKTMKPLKAKPSAKAGIKSKARVTPAPKKVAKPVKKAAKSSKVLAKPVKRTAKVAGKPKPSLKSKLAKKKSSAKVHSKHR